MNTGLVPMEVGLHKQAKENGFAHTFDECLKSTLYTLRDQQARLVVSPEKQNEEVMR